MSTKALRLPLTFPVGGLLEDLACVDQNAWIAHFNAGYHDGGWSGVTLRAPAGEASGMGRDLYPGPGQPCVDTPLLDRCANVRAALAQLHCPLLSVRFLKLRPGGIIREHCDDRLGFEDGEVRVHVPVQSSPDVEFYLDGERIVMAPGEAWYLNVNLPHRVQNLGATDRVHLVIDCQVNDWLTAMFAGAESAQSSVDRQPTATTVGDEIRVFQEEVWHDPALQAALWPVEEGDRFVRLALQMAKERGHRFTDEDLLATMRRARSGARRRWNVG